jgi:hypothetical protein
MQISIITITGINLFSRERSSSSPKRLCSPKSMGVKDFLFVDAVSGAPIRRKEMAYAPRVDNRARRTRIEAILFGLIALIVLLVTWALS